MMSGDSCRMRGIKGVGTVNLVYVGSPLRMGSDSFLVPVWRSVGDEFTVKGESDMWVVREGTWRPGNIQGSRIDYLPHVV